jgi:hypothetical protein
MMMASTTTLMRFLMALSDTSILATFPLFGVLKFPLHRHSVPH